LGECDMKLRRIICLAVAVAFAGTLVAPAVGQESGNIEWEEGKGTELEKKFRKKSNVFEDFDVLSGKKKKNPVMIYFYWPETKEDEKASSKDKKQLHYCKKMEEKLFSDSTFAEVANEFFCVKVNLKELHKDLSKKYKVKYAPYVLIFDCMGDKVGKIDNPEQDVIGLLIALREIISKSNEKRE